MELKVFYFFYFFLFHFFHYFPALFSSFFHCVKQNHWNVIREEKIIQHINESNKKKKKNRLEPHIKMKIKTLTNQWDSGYFFFWISGAFFRMKKKDKEINLKVCVCVCVCAWEEMWWKKSKYLLFFFAYQISWITITIKMNWKYLLEFFFLLNSNKLTV